MFKVGEVYIIIRKHYGEALRIEKGIIKKVGKKYIYIEPLNRLSVGDVKINKESIVKAFPLKSGEAERWREYLNQLSTYEEEREKAKKRIEEEEYEEMLKRIQRKLQEWQEKNPPPTPPNESIEKLLKTEKWVLKSILEED